MMINQATFFEAVEQQIPHLIIPQPQIREYNDNQFSTDICPDPQLLFEVIDFKSHSNHQQNSQQNHESASNQEQKTVKAKNKRKNGLFNSTKAQNKQKQQSNMKNFIKIFIRQLQQTIKSHLKNNQDDSFQNKYLRFVSTNIKQTRKSLIMYAVYEENQSEVEKQFKIFTFPTDNKVGPQQELNIQGCKKYLTDLLYQQKENLVANAHKRQLKGENRKNMFAQYVAKIIESLKCNKLKLKDKTKYENTIN